MQDLLGNDIKPGDYLTDGRGKFYCVLETFPSFQAVRIAFTHPAVYRPDTDMFYVQPEVTYARLYSCLKLEKPCSPAKARELYQAASKSISNKLKEELIERRNNFDQELKRLGIRKE